MDYQRRKELGQARKADYLHRLDEARTLARLFWGFVAGAGFVFVMGLVAGVDSPEKLIVSVICIGTMVLFGNFAQFVVAQVERTRRY